MKVFELGRSRFVEPFVGNAMWVTGLTDSDGYRLHFESPTETPEGTSLSEVTKSR
jgi:hypothetical protein